MHKIKCVVVGDEGVGKMCLLISYTSNEFPSEYVPRVFENNPIKGESVRGEPYEMYIYETSGQENFDKLRALLYPQTNVFLVCFSTVSPSSFKNVKDKWVPEITEWCPKTPFLLVGTHLDLRNDGSTVENLARNRQEPISFEQGVMLANELRAVRYVECSALTMTGLNDVFDEAILAALDPPAPEN